MVDDTAEVPLDILDQNDAGEVILNNRVWGNAPVLAREPKTNIDEIVRR